MSAWFVSWAEPQWQIPLYVWLKILALSRSWSSFQSFTPQVRQRSVIFLPYKSETKSIPVFLLRSSLRSPITLLRVPSPSSQTLPTSASQEFKCFSEEQELSQLPMGIDPWPWSGLLVRVLWIPVSRTEQNRTEQNLFIIHRVPDSTYCKKIIGITKTVLFQSSYYSLQSRRGIFRAEGEISQKRE